MNVLLPVLYKKSEYIVEYNEPDSTPDPKDYIVRMVSIKGNSDLPAELEEQVGKEFRFRASDKFKGDTNLPLDLLIKTYRDHIAKDVDPLHRV
jgi:hypothetical protein